MTNPEMATGNSPTAQTNGHASRLDIVPAPSCQLVNARTRQPLDLNWLRSQTQITSLAGIRKLGAKHGIYELLLEDGTEIELGTARELLEQRKVRAAILDGTQGRVLLKDFKASWRAIAQAIAFNAEVVDTQSPAERFADALAHFERCSRVQVGGDHDVESAGWWSEAVHQLSKSNLTAAGHRGCVRGAQDTLIISLEPLRAFLKYEQYPLDFTNKAHDHLTRADFLKDKKTATVDGGRHTIRFWRSPPGWGREE